MNPDGGFLLSPAFLLAGGFLKILRKNFFFPPDRKAGGGVGVVPPEKKILRGNSIIN